MSHHIINIPEQRLLLSQRWRIINEFLFLQPGARRFRGTGRLGLCVCVVCTDLEKQFRWHKIRCTQASLSSIPAQATKRERVYVMRITQRQRRKLVEYTDTHSHSKRTTHTAARSLTRTRPLVYAHTAPFKPLTHIHALGPSAMALALRTW